MNYNSPMFRLKKNYSLPKIRNTSRTKYPKLYESSTSFYKTRQKDKNFDSTTDFFVRNYDNYLSKINRRSKFYNSRLMSETELNALLYKLKNYYSDVLTINNKKEESLTLLKETLKFEQFKLNQVIEFQDIELPDEKISVKNFNELKLTKNEVEKKLRNLLKEKQYLDELLKNAGEYFKTIEYMCEDEKNRFMEIKKETNIIEERINNVKQYQRIVDYNLGKDKIKNEEEKEINTKLDQDIELVDKMNLNQKKKNEKLDKIIFEKEKEIEGLKNRLLELKKQNKKQNDLYQNDIQQKIDKAKEEGELQKNREKKCVEIIYCLCLIQNYFINEENFDRNKMQSSNEYKLLSNNKFDIAITKKNKKESKNIKLATTPTYSEKNGFKLDNNDKKSGKESKEKEKEIDPNNFNKKMSLKNAFPLIKIENENSIENLEERRPNSTKNKNHSDFNSYLNNILGNKRENEKEDIKDNDINDDIKSPNEVDEKKSKDVVSNTYNPSNNKVNKTKSSIRTSSTYSNNLYNTKKSNLDLPSLEELKEKFESIKINKEILFNYNSKLTSKLNFFKTQFDQFHGKELLLEEKKSLFHKKAAQVISEDYLTFNQLAKIKPEIKEFFINNSELITEIKHENKKSKLSEINQQIKQSNPVNNVTSLDNVKNVYQIDDQLNNNANLLISSSERIIMANKNFFIKCNDCFKQIINTIDTIKKKKKKENEKKKNNIIDNENMSEVESKDNKEEITTDIKIDQEFTKIFTEENEQLEKLLKKMEESIPNDKKELVNYIKELINYIEKDESLAELFNINELKNDLLYHFYKDQEGKKIKTTFYNQFQLKRFPKLRDTFNHFTIYLEPTVNHIKNIIKIIKEIESNNSMDNIINLKNNKFQKKTLREASKLSILSSKNVIKGISELPENIPSDTNEKINLRYISRIQNINNNRIFQGFGTASSQKDTSYSELEFMGGGKIDEDDILDNQVEKKEKKVVRKRVNSIEENIVNKLYSPFLDKTWYLRKLNKNMKGIKSMTTYNCKANHTLRKRTGEVDIVTHQMLIYNNPLINPNKLAKPTYNSLVKLAISTQNMYKNDQRFKSTFTPKYKEM